MEEEPLKDTTSPNEGFAATSLAEDEDLCSQTMDFDQWFPAGLTATGSYDLGIVAAPSFGKVLDALPIPILMIDGSFEVVFANKACARMTPNYEKIQGVPFATLVPRSRNAEKARWLVRKVFSTRRPQVADAILQLEAKKIWGRLHFTSIRMGRERYVLVLIEDLTCERTQLLLNKRDSSQVRRTRQELEKLVNKLATGLTEARSRLVREVDRHLETKKELDMEKARVQALSESVPVALAIISQGQTFGYVNGRFRELFHYPSQDSPDLADWLYGFDLGEHYDADPIVSRMTALTRLAEGGQTSVFWSPRSDGETSRPISIRVMDMHGGDYLVTCE